VSLAPVHEWDGDYCHEDHDAADAEGGVGRVLFGHAGRDEVVWGAIHQLLIIILKLRILLLLPVSTMPYVVIVRNYT
jgi:hypothetical protein